MRELSLHVLDVLENALTAGATSVDVTVAERPGEGVVEIVVDDDGPGLDVPPEVALDPFYTTKPGHAVGLGLGLFRDAAVQSGGSFELSRSPAGGLRVRARLGLAHVDRAPLGDLASTLAAIACTHPDVELRCAIARGDRDAHVSLSELRRTLPEDERDPIALAGHLAARVREAERATGLVG